MSRSDKKSQITVSLSWVFMGIVGMFFIILAYNIVTTYQDNEEAKYEIELKQTLRNIFNNVGRTAGVEDNSFQPIGNIFYDSKVDIICVDQLPILSINNNYDTNNQFLQNYPAFMTSIENSRTDQTYLVVEGLKLPFRITNMLAIISKRNLIVFDENSDITELMIEKIKKSSYSEINYIVKDFSTDLVNLENEISRMNLNSVMLISDSGVTLNGFSLSDITDEAYLLQVNMVNENHGEMIYFEKDGTSYEYNYIDPDQNLNLITMGMFSDPETFECSYNKIIDTIPQIYDFYIHKSESLANKSSIKQTCSTTLTQTSTGTFVGDQQVFLYQDMKTNLESLRDHITSEKFNKPNELYNILEQVKSSSETLESFNCEYVY